MREIWTSLHVEGSTMDRLNLPFFYQLGAAVKPLTDMQVGQIDDFSIVIAGVEAAGTIRTLLNTFGSLTVCKASADNFLASLDTLMEQWRQDRKLPEEQRAKAETFSDARLLTMINAAKEFQTIATAELQTLAAYHITEKALFSTTRLVERAENILPQDMLQDVPQEAREDINQAGRCLAFDLPTAVGFHTWRAVETVLVMYCKEFGISPKRKDWGSYIAALKTSRADPTTIAVLDQIRALHRNPTMHPEIVLSIDEATGLFGIAPSAIVAMVADIRRNRATVNLPPASQSRTGSNAP